MKISCLTIIISFLCSCGMNVGHEMYDFDNFKDTPLSSLAQAVRADDQGKIQMILKEEKLDVDFKDPKFKQTLLGLSIQNSKRNAFVELLKAGANPNQLLGNPADATPFIYAIRNIENCDLFYVDTMLKYGADPNFKINNPKPGFSFEYSFPLLTAIGAGYENGKECLELVKLLVSSGADINICYRQPQSDLCEGVVTKALTTYSMETLQYFVVEKHINIPDTVIIYGGVDKNTQKAYGLEQVLNSPDYLFEDFTGETGSQDQSKKRKARQEILEYLNSRY